MLLKKLTGIFRPMKNPHQGKWVYCYLPSIDDKVQIYGETINYWLVHHERRLVVKSACSSTPSTKAKAVKRPR